MIVEGLLLCTNPKEYLWKNKVLPLLFIYFLIQYWKKFKIRQILKAWKEHIIEKEEKVNKQAWKGFRPLSAMLGIRYFQNLGNFLGILLEFFGNSLVILWVFFGDVWLGGFWFGNFLWILCEFYQNSLWILSEFFVNS